MPRKTGPESSAWSVWIFSEEHQQSYRQRVDCQGGIITQWWSEVYPRTQSQDPPPHPRANYTNSAPPTAQSRYPVPYSTEEGQQPTHPYPDPEENDSGYGTTPAYQKQDERPGGLQRTTSAPPEAAKHVNVDRDWDIFIILTDRRHLRVDGGPDTRADANVITLKMFEDLGLNKEDIIEYPEDWEATGLNGSADILGWISLNWYDARYSHVRYRSQFDVVDIEQEQPLLIGLPTLNKENLIKFRVPGDKKHQKHVYVVSKRRKDKKPKDNYESPTSIYDHWRQRWVSLTPTDEQACREAAKTDAKTSSWVTGDDGVPYYVHQDESGQWSRGYEQTA